MASVGETWYTTNAKWRTLSRTDWGYAFANDILIRYVDVTDARLCESVLDYIATLTTFAGSSLITDGKAIGGVELWVTHFCRYETITLPDRSLGYRVQHAVRPKASDTGNGTCVVEDNCTFKVSWTFYWRAAALLDPVTAGSSGITYSIQSVNRDRETGDYSFVLEKREQLTTHIASHLISENDFEKVYEQQFLGVRESFAGSGIYTKNNTGGTISALWDVSNDNTVGVRYTQNLTKNVNCTADITQRKTVAKGNIVARRTLEHDQFRTATATQTNNQTAADVANVAPSGGKVTRKESSHNADGTYNNTKTEDQEAAVPESVKREVRNAAESITEVENSGQTVAGALPVTPTAGTLVEVVNTKSKGGLFIQRIITRVAKLWASKMVRISKDLYETQTETHDDGVETDGLPEDPPAATGGTWYERFRIRRLDGKYDTREVKHEEQLIASAEQVQSNTAFETISEGSGVYDALATAATPGSGRSYWLRWRKTLGGLYRIDSRTNQEKAVTDSVRSVVKTPFETRIVTSNRSSNASLADPVGFGNLRRNSKTNGGWYDTDDDVRTSTGAVGETQEKTIQGLETRSAVGTRNEAAQPEMPSTQTPGTLEEWIATLNDLGKYDVKRIITTGEKYATIAYVPDQRGTYTVIRYYNYTAVEESSLLELLDAGRNNTASPGVMNKFRLFDGVIVSRPPTGGGSGSGSNNRTWHENDMTQSEKVIVKVDGVRTVQTWKYTYNMKKDWGISSGAPAYSGALMPGSFFHDLGNDWYFYKKVTSISVSEEEFTSGEI